MALRRKYTLGSEGAGAEPASAREKPQGCLVADSVSAVTPRPEGPSRRVVLRNVAHRDGGHRSPTTTPGDRVRFRTTSLSVHRERTDVTEATEKCLRRTAARLPF